MKNLPCLMNFLKENESKRKKCTTKTGSKERKQKKEKWIKSRNEKKKVK